MTNKPMTGGCAELDVLTGCMTLKSFTKKATELLKNNPNTLYGIVYFDVDNLTYINSAFGHTVGDHILQIIGTSACSLKDSDELIARVSDDRFVGLYKRNSTHSLITNDFEKIKKKIDDYMHEIGDFHHIELYAGVYYIEPDDILNQTIVQMIDFAVTAHKATKKEKKRTVIVYDHSLLSKQIRENRIISALDDAIANEEISIWLQPQVDCRNGEIVGAEVLCRWISPEMGFISPGEFIPIFERDGQICQLDMFVWESACKQLKKWKDEKTFPLIPLSINVSRRDILDLKLDTFFAELIKKYELSPDLLRIEITESAYMDHPEQLIDFVNTLKQQGFTVEMDDFGSGYSSLNMLKEVPVDVLKLDLRFLSDMTNTNTQQKNSGGSIISSIIRMAKGISLNVIAEGVETEEQCVSLHNMGCTIIQGYYFAKPMPIPEYEKYVISHQVGHMTPTTYSREMSYLHELLNYNSSSSYIFDHYIGSAAILELTGNHMEIIKMNDAFLRSIGDTNKDSLKHVSEGFMVIHEQNREEVLKAIYRAIENGESDVEAYLPHTGQWVHFSYRLILKGDTSSYLFCYAVNTTEKHELLDKLNNN